MIWIVTIVIAVLMFKLGMMSIIAGMLSFGLKAALFVIIIFVSIAAWCWFRCRRGQP